MKLVDLTGNRYNKLVVIEKLPRSGPTTMWRVRCDCGKETRSSSQSLVNGKTKSCGCHRRRTGHDHRDWVGCGDLSGTHWNRIKTRSRYRTSRSSHAFDITIEYEWELYEKQGGRCALTGLPIPLSCTRSASSIASLDRIDAKIGYVIGNVQWVHKDINRMKNVFDQDYFIAMCRAVAAHADRKD